MDRKYFFIFNKSADKNWLDSCFALSENSVSSFTLLSERWKRIMWVVRLFIDYFILGECFFKKVLFRRCFGIDFGNMIEA